VLSLIANSLTTMEILSEYPDLDAEDIGTGSVEWLN
jgi:uncharacterized protein (DUF433 family)